MKAELDVVKEKKKKLVLACILKIELTRFLARKLERWSGHFLSQ